jgi:hypothetical protein
MSLVIAVLSDPGREGAVILRCTQKLMRRLRVQPIENPAPSPVVLGDWHVRCLRAGHRDVLLFTDSASRLSVVCAAKGMGAGLPSLLGPALEALLRALEVPEDVIEQELADVPDSVIARSNNRSVMGTMNDCAFEIGMFLGPGSTMSFVDMAVHLTGMPVAPPEADLPGAAAIRRLKERYRRGPITMQ